MTKIITAILALGCIILGVGISATSCPAMAAQPQQEWTTPTVHKKPVVQAHKAAPKASTKPVEAPAPVVCPVLPPAPVAAPASATSVAPPPATRERDAVPTAQPSYWERAKAHADKGWWLLWPLGGLLIGGAITIIVNAGRKVYAGYKSAKAS